MCDQNTLDWFERSLSSDEITGKSVLEVGSRNVNGSVRPGIAALQPSEYVGTDLSDGNGVDEVCAAEELASRFGENRFDVVVSSCVLEHVRNWQTAISNIKRVCRPDGLILMVMPSRASYHGYPHDYWRYSPKDIEAIFSDCRIISIEEDEMYPSLVYMKSRKPRDFSEKDLGSYCLYSVICSRRVSKVSWLHYLSPSFAFTLMGYAKYRLRLRLAGRGAD